MHDESTLEFCLPEPQFDQPPLPRVKLPRVKRKQGFAVMTPEQRREIASRGGKKAHEMGTAHRFTTEEAKDAGRKGGLRSAALKRKQQEPQANGEGSE